MEAIRSLHQQLDDDDNGNIDLTESDDVCFFHFVLLHFHLQQSRQSVHESSGRNETKIAYQMAQTGLAQQSGSCDVDQIIVLSKWPFRIVSNGDSPHVARAAKAQKKTQNQTIH